MLRYGYLKLFQSPLDLDNESWLYNIAVNKRGIQVNIFLISPENNYCGAHTFLWRNKKKPIFFSWKKSAPYQAYPKILLLYLP